MTDACLSIACILNGLNDKTQAVIEPGVGKRLTEILPHPQHSVRTAVLRCICAIISGDKSQVEAMIGAGVLPGLHSLLSSESEGDIEDDIIKWVCEVVYRITNGTPAHIQAVTDAGIVPLLIGTLKKPHASRHGELMLLPGGLDEPSWIRYLVSQGYNGGSAKVWPRVPARPYEMY